MATSLQKESTLRFKLVLRNELNVLETNFLIFCKYLFCIVIDQKWRKACSASSRKTKDSNMNILSNNIDKNENNDNIVSDINENNFQWKEGSV